MPPRTRSSLAGGLALAIGLPAFAALATPGPAAAVPGAESAVFVNEIHYDNDGTDAGEFVEIANPAGADLTGWSVVLYNGNGGATYDTDALGGAATIQSIAYGANGIQNGDPDGVALVDASGTVVQFLSYDGTLTATNGPASGQTSTDIAVTETSTTPTGQSLQLTGSGATYGDFTWTGPADDNPGAANTGQTFTGGGGPAQPVASCGDGPLAVDTDASGSRDVSAVDADSRIVSASITSAEVAGITLDGFTASAADGEPGAATLNVADTTPDGRHDVEIKLTTDDDPAQSATCTVTVVVSDQDAVTPISTVQGDGAASPLVGERVNVEAVVTSVITADDVTDGFFLQEEDADADTDAATSEGIYVFCRNACPADLAAGDRYRVSGEVAEFNDSTQIGAAFGDGSLELLGSGAALPTAAVVELPAGASTEDPATFEDVEGMRTTISTTLAVSEYFNQARFGEIVLTANERAFQFTQTDEPSVEGYTDHLADLATRQIILDDDSNSQNAATSGPEDNEPYYYPTPGLSTGNFFRGGDTITELTGVFEYAFGAWKVRPVAGADYGFESANPRPAAPDAVGGRIQVGSFNVLNYFTSIDDGLETCGPAGDQECRGADSQAELDRQRAKIVDALGTMDAEVVGLIEIQNDGDDAAVADLVAALNQREGAGTYDYVETGFIGTDAIKQAFIYQPAAVRPVGDFDLLTSADDARFDDQRNRPTLIQTFEEVATDERVTVAVNHLKSKGSGCGAGDDSPADGSGNCDGTRTAAAQALADHLASDPTGSGDSDTLVIGDLNSYAMERPITALREAGYTDLLQQLEGPDAYGYLFDGQLGTLDYGLATASLTEQVTGAGGWKINADENPLFDYNDAVHDTAGEPDFERKSSALPLFEPNAYRSSDHDPVVVGLELGGDAAPVETTVEVDAGRPSSRSRGRSTATATVTGGESVATGTVRFLVDGDLLGERTLDEEGAASLRIGPFPRRGDYTLTVEYSGDEEHAPSEGETTFTIGKDRQKGRRG